MPSRNNDTTTWQYTKVYNRHGVLVSNSESQLRMYNSRDEGFNNPGYWRSIANLSGATTPLSGQSETFKQESLSTKSQLYNKYTGDLLYAYSSSMDIGMFGPRVYNADYDGKATQQALVSFNSAANSAVSGFSGGVFLGELKETIKMIRSPLSSLTRSIGNYANRARKEAGKHKTSRRKQQAIHDTYLEYVFGWAPLLNDVDSAMQALAEYQVAPVSKRIHASSTVTNDAAEGSVAVYNENFYQPLNIQLNWTSQTTSSAKIIGAVSLKSKNTSGAAPALAEKFGFTLSNFAPTVYNLIPLSFVLDYFSNIGTFVEGVSFDQDLLMWVNLTEMKIVHNYGGVVTSGEPYGTDSYTTTGEIHGGTFDYTGKHFIRSRSLPTITTDAIKFKGPNLKQMLNLGVLVSAIARSRFL
jgi:hypothetical protein